jgi:fumarylacetoacetase
MKLGIFSRGDGPRHVGMLEGETVIDLGPGDIFDPDISQRQALGDVRQVHVSEVQWHLPFQVADYVDFFSSLEHATNAGKIFRPDDEPLFPNWRRLPVGYHGRAGTVVVSGTDVRRPYGQRGDNDFGPTRKLDFELELGFVIGKPADGPVPVDRALEHVFGAVLVNDWSARDIQAWETRPLGPFLGKSFATSISPWVTTLDELTTVAGPVQEPEPLEYLRGKSFAYDLPLEVELNGTVIARTNARHLYWNVAQQIAHLTSNGSTLRTGDLLATGTISGPGEAERGCLLELTWNEGPYLADGDDVVLRAAPLGEVRGKIVAPTPVL